MATGEVQRQRPPLPLPASTASVPNKRLSNGPNLQLQVPDPLDGAAQRTAVSRTARPDRPLDEPIDGVLNESKSNPGPLSMGGGGHGLPGSGASATKGARRGRLSGHASPSAAASPVDAKPLAAGRSPPARSCLPELSLSAFVGRQLLLGVDETVTAEMEEESARKRRKGVYHFLQVPHQLERLLLLGYLVCLDSFLFMITALPVRVFGALVSLCVRRRLSWLQVCDVMCVAAIVATVWALGQIDTSQAYHSVKGQAVIKLYVVFNVLEVFHKLCASFGQDILHTLFWSSMARRTWRGNLVLDFVIVLAYLVVHALVLFYQVVSLNVAVNSHNNVLITLLVSNNFVELKSNVFKRFDPDHLFQVACSDMVERFQLTMFLLIVSLHVLSVQGWRADAAALENVGGAVLMVAAAELLVDWIKHAFVIKFNGLTPAVYRRFHHVLCRDLANTAAGTCQERQAGPHMLQSGASTRIGFSCMPLLCVVIRSVGSFVLWLRLHTSPTGILILVLAFALLCVLKLLISVALTGYACERLLNGAATGTAGDKAATTAHEGEHAGAPPSVHQASGSALVSGDGTCIAREQTASAASGPGRPSDCRLPVGNKDASTSPFLHRWEPSNNANASSSPGEGASAASGGRPARTSAADLDAAVNALGKRDSLIRRNVSQFSPAPLDNGRRPARIGDVPSVDSAADL